MGSLTLCSILQLQLIGLGETESQENPFCRLTLMMMMMMGNSCCWPFASHAHHHHQSIIYNRPRYNIFLATFLIKDFWYKISSNFESSKLPAKLIGINSVTWCYGYFLYSINISHLRYIKHGLFAQLEKFTPRNSKYHPRIIIVNTAKTLFSDCSYLIRKQYTNDKRLILNLTDFTMRFTALFIFYFGFLACIIRGLIREAIKN